MSSLEAEREKFWESVIYFKPDEFDSPDMLGSGLSHMSKRLVHFLDVVRKSLGEPIYISSGFRTIAHNREIGGTEKSRHLWGEAADIPCVNSRHRMRLITHLTTTLSTWKQPLDLRIGLAKDHLHIDVGTGQQSIFFE